MPPEDSGVTKSFSTIEDLEQSEADMSSKERTRKYRERLNADPVTREDILRERRKKYEEKKQKGKNDPRSVKSLPPSKQDTLREKWRNAQRIHRKRKHELDAVMNLTPPSLEVSLNEDDIAPPINSSTPPEPSVSSHPSTTPPAKPPLMESAL
ncbi:cyclin-dependent kinase 12-like [Cololabis saira]|uniref:cyclin-dependent kinase 12-like n=1 Tax=Cololabis saira TaxID=129043 RepID=UPI002AD54931|nr:cyclin-dependent kinase 12-like [Cololabis saira]